jgi:hypothetical protein
MYRDGKKPCMVGIHPDTNILLNELIELTKSSRNTVIEAALTMYKQSFSKEYRAAITRQNNKRKED